MQWLVHGTDSGTGRPMMLAVEDAEATGAVQAAMSRGILVTRVTIRARRQLATVAILFACLTAVALGGLWAGMYWNAADHRAQLRQATVEKNKLSISLGEADATIADLTERTAKLEKADGGAGRQLVDELEAAKQKAVAIEKDLAAARARVTELEKTSGTAAKKKITKLEGEVRELGKRLQELDGLRGTAAGLEKANQELADQVEVLKTQLLVQAVKSTEPTVGETQGASARAMRWALRTNYDTAADFVAMHFDKDATMTATGGEGTLIMTSVLSANAATIRIVHDLDRQRLYSATLAISLAADAPREKLAENEKLIEAFVRTLAPGFKEPGAWLAEAARELAGKDEMRRLVRVGEDYKLTVWNNRMGVYSWKIESPRGEVE